MDAINNFLDAPVKLWHLLVGAVPLFITLSAIQKQVEAITNVVDRTWHKLNPPVDDDFYP